MTMKQTTLGLALGAAAFAAMLGGPVMAAGDGIAIERKKWSFSGPFGHFDKNQLQRGFMIYEKVCASCHGLSRIAFRNLSQKGGPEFPEAGVRSLAATYKIDDLDANGEPAQRAGRLSDRIPGPYKNDVQARARNGGSLPPDLSLIAKGRNVDYTGTIWYHPISMLKDVATAYQEGGADYLYALLTSYKEKAPAYRLTSGRLVSVAETDVKDEKSVVRCASVDQGEGGKPDTCNAMAQGMHYNASFPGHQISMFPPLSANDSRLKYTDGAPTTQVSYAADVTAFLFWTADPTHDERKNMGWQVLLYLLITAVLLFISKKRLWREVH